MSLLRAVVVFALSVALICTPLTGQSSQQTANTVQRDSQAIAVLGQALAAMASPTVTITDAVLQGTYSESNGASGTLTTKCLGTQYMRNDINLSGASSALL